MKRIDLVVSKLALSIHEVIVETQITEEELIQAIHYLTEVGQSGEFHLLSDVLGISVLVDKISHPDKENTTPSNVEGPLYRQGSPVLAEPVRICNPMQSGRPLFVFGLVADAETGKGLEGALIDVWQTNDLGRYENEDPEQEDYNLRGKFKAGKSGKYEFGTIVPVPYEVPKHGPVGRLLAQLGRHAFRPAHIHFKVFREGYEPLTTQVFFKDDLYLDSDVIGGVKKELVYSLEQHDTEEELQAKGLDRPFFTCEFNIALKPKK